ncbi:hypothetical protein [Priestia aryabhattai]|uniref:hypothetical protein n=1 Tax=Priestia aryabhattai TaxID=412384 RepID=UPI0037351056
MDKESNAYEAKVIDNDKNAIPNLFESLTFHWTKTWRIVSKANENEKWADIHDVYVTLLNNGDVNLSCVINSYKIEEKDVRGNKRGYAIYIEFLNGAGGPLAQWITPIVPIRCGDKDRIWFTSRLGGVSSGIFKDVVSARMHLGENGAYYLC